MSEIDLANTNNTDLRIRYKEFRKKLLGHLPFVKRRRHERALARMEAFWVERLQTERRANLGLGLVFMSRPPLASTARYVITVPMRDSSGTELCLFVTHASAPDLKPHVADHIHSLVEAGIAVILVVNTDLAPADLTLHPDLIGQLHGCIVRENVGYDFAAWAHAYVLSNISARLNRLYLINDSVVGPLHRDGHRSMLQRIRENKADLLGLTGNPYPFDHLQSYFLVINEHLLRSSSFDDFMRGIVNMPSKESVIDCYEVWLTRFFEDKGFSSSAIFPKVSTSPTEKPDDTLYYWNELLAIGFPFVKASAIATMSFDEACAVVPPRYLVPRNS